MKWILPLYFLFVAAVASFAQSSSLCSLPFQCSSNLRDSFFTDAQISTKQYSYAAGNEPATFHDIDYKDGSKCGLSDNCTNSTSQLVYQAYYPSSYNYNTCKLPLIVLIHGGSFADCNGSYTTSDIQLLCKSFAKRGYVAVSVEYRLGVLVIPSSKGDYYSAQQMLAIWRAGQDVRGALRSIIRREMEGKQPYRIDTSAIFIGGASAGSVTAMNVAYYNKTSQLNAAYPGISNTAILGAINQNYYYGGKNISYSIKGVLNLWGGTLVPAEYLKKPEKFFFVTGNDMPPMIAFQGMNDGTFSYTHEDMRFPPAGDASMSMYTTETRCLNSASATYSVTANPSSADGYFLGTQDMYNMLKRKNVLSELYLDCDMGHGLDSNSDFGLSNKGKENILRYIVQRAATFFQASMNKVVTLNTTKFVQCENYRNTCATADNNNHCATDANPQNQSCTPSSSLTSSYIKNEAAESKSAENGKISLYPNPVKSLLQLELKATEDNQVTIADMNGKVVKRLIYPRFSNRILIDVSGLRAGMYSVSVAGKKETFHSRFLKMQ